MYDPEYTANFIEEYAVHYNDCSQKTRINDNTELIDLPDSHTKGRAEVQDTSYHFPLFLPSAVQSSPDPPLGSPGFQFSYIIGTLPLSYTKFP